MESAEFHDPLGFFAVLADIAPIPRPVDRDALEFEGVSVEQQVGQRMLIIELVVRIRIEEDPDFLCLQGAYLQARAEYGKKGEKKDSGWFHAMEAAHSTTPSSLRSSALFPASWKGNPAPIPSR
jgi:hypothetical protein